MAPALVAVEIAPPDAAPALRQSLLDACGRAAEERCVEPQQEQTEPNVVAIVSWADPLHARLEVALRREQRWVVRTIGFVEQDAAEERWRAVGLVIGTLSSLMAHNREPPAEPETQPGPRASSKSEPSPPAPSPPPPPATVKTAVTSVPAHVEQQGGSTALAHRRPRRRAWIGAAVVAGSALNRGSPRLGAELDGNLFLVNDFYGFAGASYSTALSRVDGVQTSFAEMFLGARYARELGRTFVASLHVEGLVERFSPSIRDGSGGPTIGERWLGGARLGADLFYWGTDPVGFFAGAAGKWTAGVTDVRSGGDFVGSAPSLGYVLRAGTSLGFR